MNLIETAAVADAVNELLFEVAQAPTRDPVYRSANPAKRNIPRVKGVDGVDVIIPPIHFTDEYGRDPVLSPHEARIAYDSDFGLDITAVSTEGTIHPPAHVNSRMVAFYSVQAGERNAFEVTRKSMDGTVYSFSTERPEVVVRALAITLGKVSDKIRKWSGPRFSDE
jgi:hypothetical protein